ncbi:MAG: hypothetical protein KGH79_02030 [Patescibacteria group bacterium]|nr:hypothetical protein [Patescibacteria group bacterium]
MAGESVARGPRPKGLKRFARTSQNVCMSRVLLLSEALNLVIEILHLLFVSSQKLRFTALRFLRRLALEAHEQSL